MTYSLFKMLFLIPILLVIVFLAGEGAAYFWHKSAAHGNYSGPVGESHWTHHKDETDDGDGDFLWVLAFLIPALVFLCWLYLIGKVSLSVALIVGTVTSGIFIWNWLVHKAYHTEGHWLEKYSWFLRDKKIHMEHHRNPEKNYGISFHIFDELFDTFSYPYSAYTI